MNYDKLAELFRKYAGYGKGGHHNRASTRHSANPRYLYFPNDVNTKESCDYSYWDKYPCDAETFSHLIKVGEETDSVLYELRPPSGDNRN